MGAVSVRKTGRSRWTSIRREPAQDEHREGDLRRKFSMVVPARARTPARARRRRMKSPGQSEGPQDQPNADESTERHGERPRHPLTHKSAPSASSMRPASKSSAWRCTCGPAQTDLSRCYRWLDAHPVYRIRRGWGGWSNQLRVTRPVAESVTEENRARGFGGSDSGRGGDAARHPGLWQASAWAPAAGA